MSSTEDPRDPPPPSDPAAEKSGAHIGARLRRYFLTGVVVAGPLAITVYLTWSFVTWVDDLVRPLIPLQ